ncbi:MAG: 50S ribosomal protein L13 [Rhodobacteraceae bacterium]|nr:50S ribosomal protein L13 [Paracoccaceae bacterium]
MQATALRNAGATLYSLFLAPGGNDVDEAANYIVQMTGNKRQENFYWHTGHPGGIKSRTKQQILEGAHPERVVTLAVKRMLPGNRLSRKIMTNLRVYAGSEHPHEAQSPEVLDVKSMNPKNTRVAS